MMVKDEDVLHAPVVVKKNTYMRVGALGVYHKTHGTLSAISAFSEEDAADGESAMTTAKEVDEWRRSRVSADAIVFFDNLEPMLLVDMNARKRKK